MEKADVSSLSKKVTCRGLAIFSNQLLSRDLVQGHAPRPPTFLNFQSPRNAILAILA